MKKITKYTIIDDGKLPENKPFGEEVQKLIEQGWQPFGPPFARKGNQQAYLCQCMVQYHPTDNV